MGVWFVATALGNLFAGVLAGQLETVGPVYLFKFIALGAGAFGLAAVLVAPRVEGLMRAVR